MRREGECWRGQGSECTYYWVSVYVLFIRRWYRTRAPFMTKAVGLGGSDQAFIF